MGRLKCARRYSRRKSVCDGALCEYCIFFLHSITRRVFARHSSCVRFNFIFVNDILWLLKFLNA